MASTVLQIMEAIETQLATISGLRVSEYKPDAINPPQAIVGVPPIDYWETFNNGSYDINATITVLTSAAYDRVGQRKLAGYADPTGAQSIFAAFKAAPAVGVQTLGGVVDSCAIKTFRPLGIDEVAAIGYFGGIFELIVLATGV